jgi:hypothetical protein
MGHVSTFHIDLTEGTWTERGQPPRRVWIGMAVCSIALHVVLVGALCKVGQESAGALPTASRSIRISVLVPSTSRVLTQGVAAEARAPMQAVVASPRATSTPTRRVGPTPKAPTPVQTRGGPPSSTSAAPAVPVAPLQPPATAVQTEPIGAARPPASPSTSSPAIRHAPPESASAAPAPSPTPLDLAVTRRGSVLRDTSTGAAGNLPALDDLHAPPVPGARGGIAERRTNDGIQLRRGTDCIEVRHSRQSMLDPFSAADRPGARGVQPCD